MTSIAPNLIISNAVIHTMDRDQPTAEAVAILGNRIVAIGASADILKLASPTTRVIDAKKRLVLPGFNDAHTHFLMGGFQLSRVNLRDADSPKEFAARIRWPEAKLPTKELIDSISPDIPVFVNRLDWHMAIANSLVLQLAGVTRDTPDPPGGVIVRDSKTGEPTGILKDAAQSFVWNVMPPSTFDEKLIAAQAATTYAASLGVTSVQDVLAGSDVGVYQTLLDQGELKTRIYAVTPIPAWERLAATGVRANFGSGMLRVGGLKGFADGSLGSTTALFFEPYEDEPETSGITGDEMVPEGAMLDRVRGADKAGLQTIIHAIGDRANDLILTLFEQVAAENGDRDRRFRIEHAQHLRPQDIKRFAASEIIASMQPYHAIDDGRWAERRIGKERAKGTYAFRSLLDSGATLAFGTDWTVGPLNPLRTIYAAVTRRTLDGKNPDGWIPEQKISVEEAVRAYTVGSAYAEFQESVKGTISVGKLADVVVLSGDIFRIDPNEIENVKVVTTIVDGRVVYEERE